mmetsp:Transcript_37700/g.121169  ORF Transcript_37700/g.121169 Transcript_37700/m.121169 type:complete len:283 (-) Transcript_37700:381-1229(-)
MVIKMDHDRHVARLGVLPREVPSAVREKENLGVHEFVVAHYADGHARAIVGAVRQKERLAIEHLLIPRGRAGKPICHSLHELHCTRRRADEGTADVECEMLNEQTPCAPAHLGLVNGLHLPLRPSCAEGVRRGLDVCISVQVRKRILQEDQVEVHNQDGEAHQQRLLEESILECGDHVGTSRVLLRAGHRQLEPQGRHAAKAAAEALGLVIQRHDQVVGQAYPTGLLQKRLQDVAAAPPTSLAVGAHHDVVGQREHHFPTRIGRGAQCSPQLPVGLGVVWLA